MTTNGSAGGAHDHVLDNGQSSDDMDVEQHHTGSGDGDGNPLDREGIPPSSGKGEFRPASARQTDSMAYTNKDLVADAAAATLKRYAVSSHR